MSKRIWKFVIDASRRLTGWVPLCRCGQPCAYYGRIGGYSVKCIACNAKNAARQRMARAKQRATKDWHR